ncbi:hypothetical protein LTSEADE_5021 [Salmonella enterica subsp. enterica serovar Adelaide str. A4-669]|uniref:Uncharacterized protein n=1 Tax=Salmonella enterica subsp. enterica serovar Adelaide str. A4-669 TaxID=913063 RepID=A0A6C8GH74_SALET|nr:hypothetical protein LTSEADE_5021 [Salmonella enterica subsp. enterica serovar Adelaide str. A4-669]
MYVHAFLCPTTPAVIGVFYRPRPVYRLFGAKTRPVYRLFGVALKAWPEGDKSAAQRNQTYSSREQ